MLNYVIVTPEFGVTFYYPYDYYNDILRYYNVGSILHSHEALQTHLTLVLI